MFLQYYQNSNSYFIDLSILNRLIIYDLLVKVYAFIGSLKMQICKDANI